MQIWVDADTCPLVIKEILCRAAEQLHVPLNLVAGKRLRAPASRYIRVIDLATGVDAPAGHIVLHCEEHDLVVTADIRLAADVVARGGYAIDLRGTLINRDNISYHRVTRELQDDTNAADADSDGPSLLTQAERREFTHQLDRFLSRRAY